MVLSPGSRSRLNLLNRLRTEVGGELPEMNATPVTVNDEEDKIGDGQSTTTKRGRYLIASKDIMSRRKIHVIHRQYCLQAVPVGEAALVSMRNS